MMSFLKPPLCLASISSCLILCGCWGSYTLKLDLVDSEGLSASFCSGSPSRTHFGLDDYAFISLLRGSLITILRGFSGSYIESFMRSRACLDLQALPMDCCIFSYFWTYSWTINRSLDSTSCYTCFPITFNCLAVYTFLKLFVRLTNFL